MTEWKKMNGKMGRKGEKMNRKKKKKGMKKTRINDNFNNNI